MEERAARFKFSLTDGAMEIEGSEAFVAVQLAKLEPLLEQMLVTRTPPASSPPAQDRAPIGGAPDSADPSLDDYHNIFALADGKIQILKDLPGSSKAQKAVSAALLLAYANHIQGISSVRYETVRDTCSAHGCLDSTNFSSSMKGQKSLFIVAGNPGSQTITLTVPGRRRASELANSLNT